MRIDFESLRVFSAVVEHGSIAAGAHSMHIVASAVSRRISELEQGLGVPLFERHSRGVCVTPAGQTLYRHVQRVFEQLRRAKSELDEYTKGVRGHVRMSVNFTAMVHYLPHDLHRFLSANSAIKIDLIEKTSDIVIDMVENGAVDFGICAMTGPLKNLISCPYRVDQLFLIVSAQHRYAGRTSIRFDEIKNEDFVGMQDGASIQTLCQRAASAGGWHLKLRIQVTNFEAVRNMVAIGLGVGVLPEVGIPSAMPGIVKIRLDEHWATRALNIVYRDFDTLPAAPRLLIQQLAANGDRTNARK